MFATGLTMANGVTRGPDGAVFASNDFGIGVDRVLDGQVELAWAQLPSSNGLVVGSDGETLYAAQTFVTPPSIAADLAHRPAHRRHVLHRHGPGGQRRRARRSHPR